jgi:hypothetical protein
VTDTNTVADRARAHSPVAVWAPLFEVLNAHADRADCAWHRSHGDDAGAHRAWLCASKYRREIMRRAHR